MVGLGPVTHGCGACGRARSVYPLGACGLRKQGHQREWRLAARTRTQPQWRSSGCPQRCELVPASGVWGQQQAGACVIGGVELWALVGQWSRGPGTKAPTTVPAGTNPKHGGVTRLVQSIKRKTVVSSIVKTLGHLLQWLWVSQRLKILGSSAEQNSGFCNDQHCRIFGGDVFREGVLAVRAVEVFSGGGSWVVCKEGHWEPWGPTAWLVLCGWPHPSFCWQLLADVSTMSVSLGIVWDELHLGPSTVPWKGEEAGHSPWSPFPPMIALANRGDPSWHCHAGLKHGVMKTKGRCSFYSSCVVILGFLCFTVSLQLLNWTPELSQSYFGAQIAVRLLVFLIGWRLGPPTLPSSWHHSCTPIYLYAFFPSPLKEYLLVTLALNLIPLSSRPMIHLFLFSVPCTFP